MSSDVTKTPLISVVMPVFNGALYLFESIVSILSQSFQCFEYIIIEDGSTDESRMIISQFEDPRIIVIENDINIGVTASLNKAIKQAKGKFIARHDCDDIARCDRLIKQVSFLQNNPAVACVGCWLQLIGASGEYDEIWEYPSRDINIKWKLLFNSAIAHPAAMFRSGCFYSVGGYDESIKRAQDYDLWCRMSEQYKLANLEEVLVEYRVHENAISQKKASEQIATRSLISTRMIESLHISHGSYDFIAPVIKNSNTFTRHKSKLNILLSHFISLHNPSSSEIRSLKRAVDEDLNVCFSRLKLLSKIHLLLSLKDRVKPSYAKNLLTNRHRKLLKSIFSNDTS